MSGKDDTGFRRGAGPYSKDYASFSSLDGQNYPGRPIYSKVEGVGDYDGPFTGPIKGVGNRQRWTSLADRQNTRGDGAYSHEGRRSTERARKQSDGRPSGGQKLSG